MILGTEKALFYRFLEGKLSIGDGHEVVAMHVESKMMILRHYNPQQAHNLVFGLIQRTQTCHCSLF